MITALLYVNLMNRSTSFERDYVEPAAFMPALSHGDDIPREFCPLP